ncbi:hypothetical protein SSBR45G_46790 [Bradyrhizobium sp. SSBR45G]|uniref:hypothetical protein n=1 Tax=unclassified Bradyrhizobium TaxID=2631580 RepID=UPI002342A71D|nr:MULTISPECIES: hypothetical protein [unclassified Bradyrhizobium]GLH79770.1 hypothetical protein SSBR45G_46790 [Bradyrhizobium sp. SSBR45G]GLH87112.1 hypothetical protein SSBR45R_45720 [Bradyrhizobium sp. SSBR45R]
MTFPDNFDRLAVGEAQIRDLSRNAIIASEALSLHARMIERAMTMLDYVAKHHPHRDDDELVLQILATRLFNSSASALGLTMRGYYQAAVALMRDVLETTFLVDYLWEFPEHIAAWRTATEAERLKKFGAVTIRKALDDRDGYTERKREAHYKLLCELGTHPTFRGFGLLMAKPSNLVNVGPFFSVDSLDAVLEELAKIMVLAGSHMRLIEERSLDDYRLLLDYLRTQAEWCEVNFRKPMDLDQIVMIEEMVAYLEQHGAS